MRQGNYARAADLAHDALATGQLDKRDLKFAYGVHAAAQLHAGQPALAIPDLSSIASLDPAPGPRSIAAADAAIAAHPNRPEAYFERAALFLEAGQVAPATNDCDIAVGLAQQAVRIPSRDRAAWENFEAGPYQAAIDDIGDSSAKVEAQPYTLLLLHPARARLGRNDEPELSRAVDPVGLADWPAPVLAFYLGRISRDQLFAAADDGPDYKTRVGQRCEANFYAGEYLDLHGETADAQELLEAAANDCPIQFFEAAAAGAELSRLRK